MDTAVTKMDLIPTFTDWFSGANLSFSHSVSSDYTRHGPGGAKTQSQVCCEISLQGALSSRRTYIYTSHLSQPRWKVYSSLKRYSEMPQDQIREEKPMGPLWSSKHLLRSSSAVLSAFIGGAFLDLCHSHIAVPTLLIRDFKHKEVQMTSFRPDC